MSSQTKEEEEEQLDGFLNQSFLDVEKIDENLFSVARGVYSGQLIGHSLVATSYGIPEDQNIHSLHSYFLRSGNTNFPILYYVDKTRIGKTYCASAVKAVQFGATVFTMQASFKKSKPTQFIHQIPMPEVPKPKELKKPIEILEILRQQELITDGMSLLWFSDFPVETRWVSPNTIISFQPEYPICRLWMKAKGHIGYSGRTAEDSFSKLIAYSFLLSAHLKAGQYAMRIKMGKFSV